MSTEPIFLGTPLNVYRLLRKNSGAWFTIEEIAQELGLKTTSVAQALSIVRRSPRVYEKVDAHGKRRFSFLSYSYKKTTHFNGWMNCDRGL